MIPNYTFRTQQADPQTTRLLHLLFYLGALLLLVAGVHSIYVYWTDWTAGDDSSHLWNLLLGILYLLVSAAVAYATYHHGRGKEEPAPERFFTIEDNTMTYELDQINGRQSIDLKGLTGVSQPSVREIHLRFQDGQQRILPVYLIDEPVKQQELLAALREGVAGEVR